MLVLEKWPKIESPPFGLKKAVLGRFLLKSRFFQVKTPKNALLRPTEQKVKTSYFPYGSPAKKAQKGHIWPYFSISAKIPFSRGSTSGPLARFSPKFTSELKPPKASFAWFLSSGLGSGPRSGHPKMAIFRFAGTSSGNGSNSLFLASNPRTQSG